ncbi:MAG: hypothetical protein QM706_01205 [Nitrospira sp.]
MKKARGEKENHNVLRCVEHLVFSLDHPVAPLATGKCYTSVSIPVVERAGIEWATWHDLRHTYTGRLEMTRSNDTTGGMVAVDRSSGTRT